MAFQFDPIHRNDSALMDVLNITGYQTRTKTSVFENSYSYEWNEESLQSMKNLFVELDAEQPHTVEFTVPQLWCWGCYETGVPTRLFEVNTMTTVTRTTLHNGTPQAGSTINIASKSSGAVTIPDNNDAVWYGSGQGAYLRTIGDFSYNIKSNYVNRHPWVSNEFDQHWTYITRLASATAGHADKTVQFTTSTLSVAELESGYSYLYSIVCRCSANSDGMLQYYEKNATYERIYVNDPSPGPGEYYGTATAVGNAIILQDPSTVTVTATFRVANRGNERQGTEFLMKGRKYNAYDLLRRALLTTDTHLLDNADTSLDDIVINSDGIASEQKSLDYPILVDPIWRSRMQTAQVQETIFEGKNLWEVLLQLGYYLHAIPYLEFAQDGTDRFILQFRQLGNTRIKDDISQKITVFTSKNLQDYFTQYDAYVTNLFSPQNVVEEWLVPKTSDGSYLISNDTAELHTSKPILEIIELDVTYNSNDAGGNSGTRSILSYIFENSIYQILTSDNPEKIRPAKGNAIYYNFGDNKIQGLQYVPPQAGSGNFSYALQEIIRREFQVAGGSAIIPQNIHYNALRFRIKYRTQDSLRVSQVRPDLARFMKNSAYEKYPHHDQFYGQQDKIVDSERLSANLFGKLIRVGNNVYQNNEYAISTATEKEAGDLVIIENEPYYVTSVDNELYPDAILQKVTYSKNFNQLSNIIVIPAEPRFYEVSERSKIRREVKIMEFFELSTVDDGNQSNPQFIPSNSWQNFIQSLIFTKDKTLPNFAYTRLQADRLRRHTGSFGQVVVPDRLFPSSDIDRSDPTGIQPASPSDHADSLVPVLHFPLHDGITFEWDMEDNFKVGDFVDTNIQAPSTTPVNEAYYAMQPLRYVDIMGRADLFRFSLFYKDSWTSDEIQTLPKADGVSIPDGIIGIQGSETMAIALDKDNREELSFNYQINLLHKNQQGDDDFITFPNLFGDKDNDLHCLLLADPQSQFNENINISPSVTLAEAVPFSFNNSPNGSIQISFDSNNIDWQNNGSIDRVQCICFYENLVDPATGVETGARAGYIYKNVDKLANEQKLQSWYIYPIFNKGAN